MPTFACEECGATFTARPSRNHRARTCSRACLAILQSRERKGTFGVGANNPNWVDGSSPRYYRRFLKPACEWCGSTKHLLIHHTDEDRHNNDPANLVTLCKSCHQDHHTRRDATGKFISS